MSDKTENQTAATAKPLRLPPRPAQQQSVQQPANSQANNQDGGRDQDQESLPALPHRDPPGAMRFLPPQVLALWEKGVEMGLDGKTGDILIEGFYKTNPLRLALRQVAGKSSAHAPQVQMVAIDRRQRETIVDGFDDLVRLNYQWWRLSNRAGGVLTPHRPWLDAFIHKGLVRRTVIYTPVDDTPAESQEGA